MINTFSIKEAFYFGWNTFRARPWFLMGITAAVVILSSLVSMMSQSSSADAQSAFLFILTVVINVFIDMGLVAFALAAHENIQMVKIKNLWAPKMFWPFLGAAILVGIIVMIGTILLIIPGIIAALGLMFTKYLVIDRELGPIEAIRESWNITKGNRFRLLGLLVVVVVINIIGAAFFMVGLLVSIPVAMLMMVHVYRELEHGAHEIVQTATEAPSVEVPSAV